MNNEEWTRAFLLAGWKSCAFHSNERPDSWGFEAKLHPARGMQKRVPLKLYAPNTIHAFECCHVSAEEARVVLKYPRVKPAAA